MKILGGSAATSQGLAGSCAQGSKIYSGLKFDDHIHNYMEELGDWRN